MEATRGVHILPESKDILIFLDEKGSALFHFDTLILVPTLRAGTRETLSVRA